MKNKGYTLIEMLIVITIIGLVLPAVFTILFSIMRQQLRIHQLNEVKKQGDYISSFMRNKITTEGVKIAKSSDVNAVDGTLTDEQCIASGSIYPPDAPTNRTQAFYFFTKQRPNYFIFTTDNENLVLFESENEKKSTLTTSKVKITQLGFACYKRANIAVPIVELVFTVEYNNSSGVSNPGDVTKLTYRSKMRLKSL